MTFSTKIDRRCPRCHKRLYHFIREWLREPKPGESSTPIRIDCADCGHTFRGRYNHEKD